MTYRDLNASALAGANALPSAVQLRDRADELRHLLAVAMVAAAADRETVPCDPDDLADGVTEILLRAAEIAREIGDGLAGR